MKVLLLGATGNLGRYVLQHLLQLKQDVVIYSRDLSKVRTVCSELHLDLSSCTLVQGSVQDSAQLAAVMSTCHSCIMTAGRPDSVQAEDALGTLFPSVLSSARAHLQQPSRFICLAGMGILPAPGGGLTYQLPFFPATPAAWSRIHEANWQLLGKGGDLHCQWVMLCPAHMTHEAQQGGKRVTVTIEHGPYFDPTRLGGRALSTLPRLLSLLALAVQKGAKTVPYTQVAHCAALLATVQQDEMVEGRPVSAYWGKRLGFYSS